MRKITEREYKDMLKRGRGHDVFRTKKTFWRINVH